MQKKSQAYLQHHGYGVIRRPLISLEKFESIHKTLDLENNNSSDSKARWILDDETIKTALEISAPGLYSRIKSKKKGEISDSDLFSIQKYLIRMATRCTPFGVFSNVAIANFVDREIKSKNTAQIRCRLRLDSGVFVGINELVKRAAPLGLQRVVKRNPLIYFVDKEIRYIEKRFSKGAYHFSLSRASLTDELQMVLSALINPKSMGSIVEEVKQRDANLDPAELIQYLRELYFAGILESNLDVSLIGEDPLGEYLSSLKNLNNDSLAIPQRLLEEIHSALTEKDEYSFQETINSVGKVELILQKYKIPFPKGLAVHIDSFASTENIVLPENLVGEVLAAMKNLTTLFPQSANDQLTNFAQAYYRRFGDELTPLGLVLDSELGIPFGFSSSVIPWMQDIGQLKNRGILKKQDPLDDLLHQVFSSTQKEIDIQKLCRNLDEPQLPSLSMTANITLYNNTIDSTKENCTQAPLGFLHYISAPGSGNLSARFAARHPGMMSKMKESLKHDILLEPKSIYAEIIHSPNPRTGNVLARPSIFTHCIVLTGDCSNSVSEKIYINDLYVSVEGGKVTLFSERLQSKIIPVSTSAFNYSGKGNLAIFQFLCAVGRQITAPIFQWPHVFTNAEFLPRVTSGRIVISPCRWKITKEKYRDLCKVIDSNCISLVKDFFLKNNISRHFTYNEGDQKLEFDSESMSSLKVLRSILKSKSTVYLYESVMRMGEPYFSGEDCSYCSEITLPLTFCANKKNDEHDGKNFTNHLQSKSHVIAAQNACEWFYFKAYGGEDMLKRLLVEEVGPRLNKLIANGEILKWHFIRYTDPDFHFRFRMFGPLDRVRVEANKIFRDVFDHAVATRRLSGIVVEKYVPETARYGGISHLPYVEDIFTGDSQYACRILSDAVLTNSDEYIWKGVLVGNMQYLNFFLRSPVDINNFLKTERGYFKNEILLESEDYDRIGEKYRSQKEFIESVVCGTVAYPEVLCLASTERMKILEKYEVQMLSSFGKDWRASVPRNTLSGIIHMQANRLFTASSRPQEFVILDFLSRAYRTLFARK